MNVQKPDVSVPSWLTDAHAAAANRIRNLAATHGAAYLHATEGGRYPLDLAWWWTSGFWPGLLHLLSKEDPDPRWTALALQAESGLMAILDHDWFEELHHDVGFQFQPTAVMRYKLTGAPDARRRGMLAANLLMGRFNIAGGVIEAWNGDVKRGHSIIDTMMNLPLLFWATETSGEPRFANLARAHLARAITEFIRADSTTHHIVVFDQNTGARVEALGGQGAAPDSAWSRGMAWAIYGLAIAARYTGDAQYRKHARAVADRFLALNETHRVPPWDFSAPNAVNAPRDSSAGATAACGLLELAELGDPDAREQALQLMQTLTEDCAFPKGEDGLLAHATGKLPQGQFIDVSLIYGDYYYFEALQRLSGLKTTCW